MKFIVYGFTASNCQTLAPASAQLLFAQLVSITPPKLSPEVAVCEVSSSSYALPVWNAQGYMRADDGLIGWVRPSDPPDLPFCSIACLEYALRENVVNENVRAAAKDWNALVTLANRSKKRSSTSCWRCRTLTFPRCVSWCPTSGPCFVIR